MSVYYFQAIVSGASRQFTPVVVQCRFYLSLDFLLPIIRDCCVSRTVPLGGEFLHAFVVDEIGRLLVVQGFHLPVHLPDFGLELLDASPEETEEVALVLDLALGAAGPGRAEARQTLLGDGAVDHVQLEGEERGRDGSGGTRKESMRDSRPER